MLNLVATGVISPELGLAVAGVHIARGRISHARTRASNTVKPRRMDWESFRGEQLKDAKDFRRYLRVSPELFDRMVAGITPDAETLNRQRRAAQNSAGKAARNDPDGPRGGFTEYPLRLAMTLRYLAGGSYLDLLYLFGVRKATFYQIVWQTLEQLDNCPALPDMTLEHDVKDQQRCRALAAGFNRRTGCQHVTGCIGALDGMALKIEAPTTSDNFHKYFCRKLFHAVSVQAVCDADRRFTYVDMSQSGSTHDSTAWNAARTLDGSDRMGLCMGASDVLRQGCPILAPNGFFLVADDAYRCCQTVMAPWSSAPLFNSRAHPSVPAGPHAIARACRCARQHSFVRGQLQPPTQPRAHQHRVRLRHAHEQVLDLRPPAALGVLQVAGAHRRLLEATPPAARGDEDPQCVRRGAPRGGSGERVRLLRRVRHAGRACTGAAPGPSADRPTAVVGPHSPRRQR